MVKRKPGGLISPLWKGKKGKHKTPINIVLAQTAHGLHEVNREIIRG